MATETDPKLRGNRVDGVRPGYSGEALPENEQIPDSVMPQVPDSGVPFGYDVNPQAMPGQGPSTGLNEAPVEMPPPEEEAGENDETETPESETTQSTQDQDKEAIKQEAKAAVMNAAKSAAKKGIARLIAVYGWPILIGLAVIILIVIIAIVVATSGNSPSESGKSAHAESNPIADRDWVKKLLVLSGDKDILNNEFSNFSTNLTKALDNIDLDLAKPENQSLPRIAEIRTAISEIRVQAQIVTNSSESNPKRLEAAKKIQSLVEDIMSHLSAGISPYSGPGEKSLPLRLQDGDIQFGSGNSLHFCTLRLQKQTDNPKANGGGHQTYLFNCRVNGTIDLDRAIGDAGDIYPKSGNGTKVYAVYSGTLSFRAGAPILTSRDDRYITVYGHTGSGKLGQVIADRSKKIPVEAGEEIGIVAEAQHLHLEIIIDGMPVNFTSSDIQKCNMVNKPMSGNGWSGTSKMCTVGTFSQYYWGYVKTIFGP